MSRRTSALGTKLTALAMSTLLATATPLTAAVAYADDTDSSSDTTDGSTVAQSSSSTAKDEIVYTRTEATGATSGTYVVNYFNTPQATEVSDPGTYDKVTNLSTSEQLEDKDGTVDLTTLAGEPFYYQGDLSSSTQLPWDIEVTYTLDGKEVSPDELSGASGDLDIELKVTGLDDDSATADFAKSFVLQAQGTFPDANFKLSDAGNATVSTVGDNTLVTFLQLPGTDGDYHIKGKATDFNYSGWQVAAMPLSLDVNVDDYDTSQLTDAAGELESATTQLADGGTSLQDGLSQLNSGAATAASGASTLSNGASTLAAGTSQLVSGTQQVNNGAAALRAALTTEGHDANKKPTTFYSGVSDLANGAHQVSGGVDQVVSTLTTAQQSVSQLQPGLTQIKKNLDAMQAADGDGAQLLIAAKSAEKNAGDLKAALTAFNTTALTEAATDAGTQILAASGELGKDNGAGADVAGVLQSNGAATTSLSSASTYISSAQSDVAAIKQSLIDHGMSEPEAAATVSSLEGHLNTASSSVSAASDSVNKSNQSANNIANHLNTVNSELTKAGADLKGINDTMSTDAMQQQLKGMDALNQALTSNLTDIQTHATNLSKSAQGTLDLSNQLYQGAQGTISTLTSQDTTNSLTYLKNGANGLATGADELQSQLEQGGDVYNGVTALTAGTQQVGTGATQVNSGATQLSSGASQLSSGLNTLSAGTQSAYTGSGTLSDGLNELRDAVSGMDQKVLDEVQETINEKLGKGYQLHSFVDADNTDVDQVQFVYVVDGVDAKDDKSDTTKEASSTSDSSDDTQDESFTSRLIALFKSDDK